MKKIYETDPYIYPAMFGKSEDGIKTAAAVLPVVFEKKRDAMFAKSNLFGMFNGAGIAGLILWRRDGMNWSSRPLLEAAEEAGAPVIGENVELVRKEYVQARYETAEETSGSVSLINVCVAEDARGGGAGTFMLGRFIEEHRREILELAVLSGNRPAVRLYEKYGFKTVASVKGFSLTPEKPDCLIMKRLPDGR